MGNYDRARLPETHLLFRPTVNSYRRFDRGAWSPEDASWGYENRTAAIRAIMKAHKALREDVSRATEVGKKRFPQSEAALIADLIRRDLPYYDPAISEQVVADMNRFAQRIGLLTAPVPYEDVVATQFSYLWKEPV